MSRLKVAALVPAYQAAAHLGEVLLGLAALPEPPHVLVVDDGSRDATAEVARQYGVQVHSFAANRGKGHALLAGFELLRDFDAVVTLDADGQHLPACLSAFVAAAEAGADLVLGTREITPDMPPARRFANRFSSAWCSWTFSRRQSRRSRAKAHGPRRCHQASTYWPAPTRRLRRTRRTARTVAASA